MTAVVICKRSGVVATACDGLRTRGGTIVSGECSKLMRFQVDDLAAVEISVAGQLRSSIHAVVDSINMDLIPRSVDLGYDADDVARIEAALLKYFESNGWDHYIEEGSRRAYDLEMIIRHDDSWMTFGNSLEHLDSLHCGNPDAECSAIGCGDDAQNASLLFAASHASFTAADIALAGVFGAMSVSTNVGGKIYLSVHACDDPNELCPLLRRYESRAKPIDLPTLAKMQIFEFAKEVMRKRCWYPFSD